MIIQSVVKGTDFLFYEAVTAGGYYFGNNRIFWAKFNDNELNDEFPMLFKSYNTTTVIIEASNYYNSVQLLIWVLIDNIRDLAVWHLDRSEHNPLLDPRLYIWCKKYP